MQRYPGTPNSYRTLPLCRYCELEVKPGEDLCWECIGENLPPEEELLYWIYDDTGGLIDEGVTSITHSLRLNDPTIIFTWPAKETATVTGLTVAGAAGHFHKTFSSITVLNGDSITFEGIYLC